MKKFKFLITTIMAIFLYTSPLLSIEADRVVLDSGVIWGFDFVDSNSILYGTKQGKLGLFNTSTGKTTEVSHSIDFRTHGQGGLLDVVYDDVNSLVFITYSKQNSKGYTTALFKGKLNGNRLQGSEIFEAAAYGSSGRHFGSRVALDTVAKTVYIGIGDRGERDKAQSLNYHNGKILRLTYDGEPLSSNPFYSRGGASREIFSYGHRNPQGLYLTKSGELFETEFGPKGGDEINLVESGKNYGWPKVTYGKEYSGAYIAPESAPGMEEPIAYYTPVISPSGMMVYENDYYPEWSGDMFIANLSSQHLRRVRIRNGRVLEEEKLFENLRKRIRHVNYSPDGKIYFSTDSGEIYEVKK
jgi:glucose/arabinose dehydrogenase